jgi:endonuclease/exonuclease/phosphatase family metal-dependent hydrolase
VALIAQVGRAGRRVWAVSIHLGLAPTERNAHVHELYGPVRRASPAGSGVIGPRAT